VSFTSLDIHTVSFAITWLPVWNIDEIFTVLLKDSSVDRCVCICVRACVCSDLSASESISIWTYNKTYIDKMPSFHIDNDLFK